MFNDYDDKFGSTSMLWSIQSITSASLTNQLATRSCGTLLEKDAERNFSRICECGCRRAQPQMDGWFVGPPKTIPGTYQQGYNYCKHERTKCIVGVINLEIIK